MTDVEETWAVVELLGHRVRAGRITEVEFLDTRLLQVEIFEPDMDKPSLVQKFTSSAIYAVTPSTEAKCRRYTAHYRESTVGPADRITGVQRSLSYDADPEEESEDDEENDWPDMPF